MSKDEMTENKMGSMPVGKLLVNMGAPLIASMLFQALYNIVDSVFVARLSQDAMNAVSLAFPLQSLCIAFAVGTGVGMNALLSRALGEKDQDRVDRATNGGIFLHIVTGILIGIICFFVAGPFFRFQTSNENILNYGISYVRVCLGCAIAVCMQMCSERLLQSTGRANLSMVTQIVGAAINMILDPIMIFGLFGFPRLEVLGAAVATVCGQVISAILGFYLNVRYNREIKIVPKHFRFHGPTIREIYRVGLPSILMQSVGSVMNLGINKVLISFTEAATAVFGAYYKIQSFIFMPVFGLNSAMVPILSYNYGARHMDRLKKIIKMSISVAVIIMVVGLILFETIPGLLLKMFSPSDEMLEVGKVAFRVIGIHFPMAGFCIIAGSVCQALDRPMFSLITSICRQLVVLLPAVYLLSLTGRLDMVWFAFPVAEVISLILSAWFMSSTMKHVKKKLA